MTKRKVNNLETFRPTDKAKPIIESAMKTWSKSDFYNGLIEKYGRVFIFENLNDLDKEKINDEISNLA